MHIGEFYELEIGKEVDFGVYLNSELGEILLPEKYVPAGAEVGDKIEVFLYKDSEDRLIATTLIPRGKLDEFVALEVTDTNPHGAFMDWGLEKDLFVPNKEQPWTFEIGRKYVVKICMDYKTERLLGVGKLNTFFKTDLSELKENDEVSLLIYDRTDSGYMAIINQTYNGLIYHNEVFEHIEAGDIKTGFIKKIREDGKIDLSLNKSGVEAMDDNKRSVLRRLESEGGSMPYHDKSNPMDIVENFEMSKKAFKKAIGGLYKDGLIDIKEDGIKIK